MLASFHRRQSTQSTFKLSTNKQSPSQFVGLFILCLFLGGCKSEPVTQQDEPAQPLFERLGPAQTGIDFINTLREHPSPNRNELLFEYFSNGAGIAVGDVNGDGLDDLFFSANMGYSRLYLNQGGLRFEDVSEVAGVRGRVNTWKTGVAMADVNGDSRLDVYVSYSGDLPLERRVDQLLINMGNDENGYPRFEDQTEEYGLAYPHSSNQAYFFDYDRDGDLDLFLQTHNVKSTPRLDPEGTREELKKEDPISGVRFYENQDNRFVDVTSRTGIISSSLTYGLGAGISDVNNDGWLDMYVGNDYSPPDYLYMNNGDGTFTDEMRLRMRHTSNASMGIDIADLNNDGWLDVVVLDMLAEDRARQKTLFIPNDRDLFEVFVESGFHHQYMRNTLQLNIGEGVFSEIGQVAGVSNTDWSWTPLIADYDNDGQKDLFVTNGILHDTIDRDFLNYKSNYFASKQQNITPEDIAYLMDLLPSVDAPNYMFRNGGAHQFEDVSDQWGMGAPLKTTGAVYSDLDNDGDLDLITSNINEYALIFENRSTSQDTNHYLQIALEGDGGNTQGIGTKVMVYTRGDKQVLEQMPSRGYLSSVSPVLHFGLGNHNVIDSVVVMWPDGRQQSMQDVAVDQRMTVLQNDALQKDANQSDIDNQEEEIYLSAVSGKIPFAHRVEGELDDFKRQPLLVHPVSFSGPAMEKGDINGDGLEDVFVGGGSGQAGLIYVQSENGSFQERSVPSFVIDRASHDVDALFFDIDEDSDLDLYVASGGYGDFAAEDDRLQDRVYINDGQGNFSRNLDALPEKRSSTGAVSSSDLNGDGFPDLFVGGHTVPGRYPMAAAHQILINDGQGQFLDGTDEWGEAVMEAGMVSDAEWYDLDGDGTEELITVGEWTPVRVFQKEQGRLVEVSERYFDALQYGIWNNLLVEDLNKDGFADLLVGNLGINTQIKASEREPAELFYDDFNNDGSLDLFLSYYTDGVRYPFMTLNELARQMPQFASTFTDHASFAETTMDGILANQQFERARLLHATTFETSLFLGAGGQPFTKQALPIEAQFSPVFTITSLDVNEDGVLDLFLGGNIDDGQIRIGKYDASYGQVLLGNGDGTFDYVPQTRSGLQIVGDVRNALYLNGHLIVGINRGEVQAYKVWSQ